MHGQGIKHCPTRRWTSHGLLAHPCTNFHVKRPTSFPVCLHGIQGGKGGRTYAKSASAVPSVSVDACVYLHGQEHSPIFLQWNSLGMNASDGDLLGQSSTKKPR
eukprot:3293417-Amphidinium_carterae.1